MPRTRGGELESFDGLEGGSGARRSGRGSKSRVHPELQDEDLDEAALEYGRDDFEINEMVLARNTERNDSWWPVICSLSSRKRNHRAVQTTPNGATLTFMCIRGREIKLIGCFERVKLIFSPECISLYFALTLLHCKLMQGILLDTKTEVPDHIKRVKQRDKRFCVMFYGPGSQVSHFFRIDRLIGLGLISQHGLRSFFSL